MINGKVEVGDKLRLATKLVDTTNKKLNGTTLVVEVTDITEDHQGVKTVVVKAVDANFLPDALPNTPSYVQRPPSAEPRSTSPEPVYPGYAGDPEGSYGGSDF